MSQCIWSAVTGVHTNVLGIWLDDNGLWVRNYREELVEQDDTYKDYFNDAPLLMDDNYDIIFTGYFSIDDNDDDHIGPPDNVLND